MALNDTWNIKARASQCAETGAAFADGDTVYAAIFQIDGEEGFERRDFCADAWGTMRADTGAPTPFSFWKTTFEVVEDPHKKPEVVAKENAEALLRRLIEEDEPNSENARYILALMLERKKLLVQVDVKEGEDSRMLIYEHAKSGEAFIVRDPKLALAEVDAIQEEVAGWLRGERPHEQAPPGAHTIWIAALAAEQ